MKAIPLNEFLTWLMIVIRVTSFLFTAPFFNYGNFPTTAKLFMGLIIAYIILFSVPVYDLYPLELVPLALLAGTEALTGIVLGFSITVFFHAVSFAGSLIGTDMGLNMATMFDPTSDIENNVIGQALYLGAMVVFLMINGHHILLRAIGISYSFVPIGHYPFNEGVFNQLGKLMAAFFIIGIKIAAPIMVSFFLLHAATGIITRVVPQMQAFFVIQPVQMALGFILLISVMPLFIGLMSNTLEQLDTVLTQMLGAMRG